MPILQIRPTSTGASAAVTSSSGTPHADLSDDNDATVVRGTADIAYVYLGLADVTLSAGQRVKQVRAIVKRARDTADVGRIEQCRVRLVYAGKFGKPDFFAAYYTTQGTEFGPWRNVAPDGGAWSEPKIDGLTAEVTWYANDSGSYFLRVSELYVDIETNSPPSVGTPTVSGVTTTTTPAWAFSYSDPDGDPQTRYRVKVFSAAQYGAAGFNADTSTATWDSAEQTGSTTSGTVGSGLVNGTTYKLYAKAAQAWTGPLGTLWWSPWGVSAAFTIALTPPATPTVTVAGQNAPPDYRVLATVVAPTSPGGLSTATGVILLERGERLPADRGTFGNWMPAQLASGGSETRSTQGFQLTAGSDSMLWEPINMTLVTGVAGMIHWVVRSGTQGLLRAGASDVGPDVDEGWRYAVVPGSAHTGAVWAWCASGTFSSVLACAWLKSDGTTSASTTQAVTITTTPTRYTVAGTCPADAVSARLSLQNTASSASAEVYATRWGFGLTSLLADGQPGVGQPVTWTTVRQLSSLTIASLTSSQTFAVQDHEVVPGRPTLYRATTIATLATGETVASAPSTTAVAYLTPPARTLLTDPLHPEQAMVARVDAGHSGQQAADSIAVHPLGRDGDPVVVQSWASGQMDGSLHLTALSEVDAHRLARLLNAGNRVLVQWSLGGRTYYAVTGLATTRVTPGLYRYEASVLQTQAP